MGFHATGTRSITACIGNRVCPYACYDTTAFAKRIEQAVFPNDLHFKIALTGCSNDCGKEHIGYIVDRTGFEEFKRWAPKDVVLPVKAEVMSPMYWKGIKY